MRVPCIHLSPDPNAPAPLPLSDDERRARQLEKDGVAAAEAGNYDAAMVAFNSAIELCPTRASCYNNRAQLYRLQHKNDGVCVCTRAQCHGGVRAYRCRT